MCILVPKTFSALGTENVLSQFALNEDRLSSPEQMPKLRPLPQGDQQDLIRIPETKLVTKSSAWSVNLHMGNKNDNL